MQIILNVATLADVLLSESLNRRNYPVATVAIASFSKGKPKEEQAVKASAG
jgi:hypothetical protein